MKKYLIFDLDWTLIKSTSLWIKNCVHVIKKYDKSYEDKAIYIFKTTTWMNLYDQVKIIFEDKNLEEKEIEKIWNEIYKRINKDINKIIFFKDIPETIKSLSKNYKLFLTTWNSTHFAIKILEQWWIKDCFELIYWSDEIKKWSIHLNLFKDHSQDERFFEKSLYFWDWDMDKLYSNEANIDFVRIWDFEEVWNDVLVTVANIDIILDKYK